jgi:hypothetical protein
MALRPLRPFAMPPITRPTFDPEMMGLPEAYNPVAPPPAALKPIIEAPSAPAPEKQPGEDQSALGRLKALGAPPLKSQDGWRGYVGSFLQGGLPGLAGHAINPNLARQREEYAVNQSRLGQLAALEDKERQRELQQKQIESLDESRKAMAEDRDAAREIHEQRMVASLGEEVRPGELIDDQRYKYTEYNGKRYKTERGQAVKPVEVTPGASLIDPVTGKVVATAPPRPSAPPPLRSVPRGGTLVGPDGKVVYQDSRQVASSSGQSSAGGRDEALINAVMANPAIYDTLTPTVKTRITPALHAAGFTGFGRAPAESAVGKIAESKAAIESLRDLRQTLLDNEQYIGPLAGLQALNPYSGARKAQAKIDLVKQRVGKALEGGVLRKEDEEKYKKILATLKDEPSTAIAKVDGIIATLERDMDIFANEQRAAGRRMPTQNSAKPAKSLTVGSVVSIGGKKHKITRVYPDGTFDAEPVKE